MMTITDAFVDKNLLGPSFAGPSWDSWRVVLKAAFGLRMSDEERRLFRTLAQRDPPKKRVKELWIVAGMRAGKDSIASRPSPAPAKPPAQSSPSTRRQSALSSSSLISPHGLVQGEC
jgi:hypothetical protein